jgi:hypothetical protein
VDHQIELDHTEGIGSFFGASSVERLPTELAIKSQAESFKSTRLIWTVRTRRDGLEGVSLNFLLRVCRIDAARRTPPRTWRSVSSTVTGQVAWSVRAPSIMNPNTSTRTRRGAAAASSILAMVTLMVLSAVVVSKDENARRKQLKDDYLRARRVPPSCRSTERSWSRYSGTLTLS